MVARALCSPGVSSTTVRRVFDRVCVSDIFVFSLSADEVEASSAAFASSAAIATRRRNVDVFDVAAHNAWNSSFVLYYSRREKSQEMS
jgi:hypothetical protein